MSKIKRKKIKKTGLLIITILVICIIGFSYLIIDSYKHQKEIYNHYNSYVKTINKTSLYDNLKKVMGTIEKNIILEVEKPKNNSEYMKIKNSNYYIYYKDIIKSKKQSSPNNNYIAFNKNIKTNKKITLLQNNINKIILKKGINTQIQYEDETNYYISLFNQIFEIPKTNNIEVIENNNTQEATADHISVLNYDTIQATCSTKTCTTTENFKNHIKILKENNYYTINKDDYEKYRKGFIQLKKRAIYIVSNSQEELAPLATELDIQIEKTNEAITLLTNKSTIPDNNLDKIDSYQIKSYSTTENILKMANGEEVIELSPDDDNQKVAVLNYHFFYGPGEDCNETICLRIEKFREHLDYLKENNFKTLTMEEFRKWMYKEIELPKKSVLITVDDGAKGTGAHNGNKLIPALEEYQMHATLFLITGWWSIENYQSKYLDVQSHTNDMHQYGPCGRGQLNCATYEQALADLKQSLEVVQSNESFCFPFYYYSDTSLKAVKDAGFKLAFVGGNRKANRSNNKYLVPRYPIQSSITIDTFKNIVN